MNPNMPECLTYQSIMINTSTGQETIDNPLYSYKFHPLPLGTDIPTDDPVSFPFLPKKDDGMFLADGFWFDSLQSIRKRFDHRIQILVRVEWIMSIRECHRTRRGEFWLI